MERLDDANEQIDVLKSICFVVVLGIFCQIYWNVKKKELNNINSVLICRILLVVGRLYMK